MQDCNLVEKCPNMLHTVYRRDRTRKIGCSQFMSCQGTPFFRAARLGLRILWALACSSWSKSRQRPPIEVRASPERPRRIEPCAPFSAPRGRAGQRGPWALDPRVEWQEDPQKTCHRVPLCATSGAHHQRAKSQIALRVAACTSVCAWARAYAAPMRTPDRRVIEPKV